tara:strand:+ start:527 stop:883 length:357 start_codon:yes stop_codon:yes gene_type:complete
MDVSALMQEYFKPTGRRLFEAPGRNVPITVKKEVWTKTENPESIRRLFEFKTTQALIDFLEDVLQMQEELGHHGKLLVEKKKVLAHASTEVLQQVTELDIEWAAKVDEIYDDIAAFDR